MREYVALLNEYGLVGMFDTITMMKGESNALIFERIDATTAKAGGCAEGGEMNNSVDVDDDSCDDSESSFIPLDERFTGQSYLDIQENSMQLAAQLYHRFGVRPGDRVLLVCRGHPGAELSASLACVRINALFIDEWNTWSRDEVVTRLRANGDAIQEL